VSIQVESENAGGGSGGSGAFPIELFTGVVKVLDLGSNKKFIVMDNASNQIVVIPENAVESFAVGAEIDFIRDGVGTVSLAGFGSVVLNSRDGLFGINAQYSAATLKKAGIDEWDLVGDLVSSEAFSPASLADLLSWHDASDLTTILEIDSPGFVSDWLDKSGNGNDVVQGALIAQPGTGVATINGLNAIDFDGVNECLTKTSLTVSSSITLFMVVNVVSVSNSSESIMAFGNTSALDFEISAGNASQFLAKFQSTGLGATTPPKSPTDLVGLDTLVVYRLSAGDVSANLRINGVDIATDTYNGGLSATPDYHIGRNRNNTEFLGMKAGELIIYARDLGLDEISVLENTLKAKWGIA